jgi:2-polyprenyl-3-methyl-5-hydroxy-6-metoxy-1,4-benzoquinol methylase
MTTDVVAPLRCQACRSTAVRAHPRSVVTGSVILECRDCGLRALEDRSSLEFLAEQNDYDCETYRAWVGTWLAVDAIGAGHAEVLARLSSLVGGAEGHSLFDVGAGDGGFLAMARDAGFAPHGNELSTGAIELAKERHDVDLELGDLSHLPDAGRHDAVTMWCVLAHVPDGDRLLTDARELLRPGGVLFLQTPRWSGMDRAALLAHDATRGRATRITDRRLNQNHMCLHTPTSMRLNLERLGYEVVSIQPRVRYSLVTDKNLESLRVPARVRGGLARIIDGLIERGWFFRNIIDVYARRPLDG